MSGSTSTGLLAGIDGPDDLKRLPPEALPALCAELRAAIVAACAPVGGHIGGSLGAVELTVALHRTFSSPQDALLFDTGHQAYAHKLLTGRRDAMGRIRQAGGPAGFLERQESPHDAWGAGHASTALSASLGFAEAFARLAPERRVVAVVGDGAATGGLFFEALAHAPALGRRVLLVLNDNGMSISPNVGAVSTALGDPAKARQLFEAMGWTYAGLIDGHDLAALGNAFEAARDQSGPTVLHVRTEKGRGFALAEADAQTRGHAMGPFDAQLQPKAKGGAPTFTERFAHHLGEAMARDPRVVAITAAMAEGTGLAPLQQRFPDRVFDVGIAEGHAVTFAAGLAAAGLRPVVCIYSTFMQRAVDQLIHDVALQRLPVLFALDRAGLVGGDGATHQGAFDLALFRAIPGVALAAPSDDASLEALLADGLAHDSPFVLRFPRGAIPLALPEVPKANLTPRVALVALGPAHADALGAAALLAREGIGVEVVDARFARPLDAAGLTALAARMPLVTIEHHARAGGFGSAVLELLSDAGLPLRIARLGLPDAFVPHGDPKVQLAAFGLDAEGIAAAARRLLAREDGDGR